MGGGGGAGGGAGGAGWAVRGGAGVWVGWGGGVEGVQAAARAAREGKVPVYFAGTWGSGAEEALAAIEAEAPDSLGAPGLHYLGRCGARHLPCGIRVAYVGGRWGVGGDKEEGSYGEPELLDVEKAVAAQEGDLDFLLTEEWPEGVVHGLTGAPDATPSGSPGASRLALTLRPRYHFASSLGFPHWARAPYLNENLGAGAHVTRFVSLGSVNNPEKHKWVNALQLVPAGEMELSELHVVPPGSTPCPYARGGGHLKGPGTSAGLTGMLLAARVGVGNSQGVGRGGQVAPRLTDQASSKTAARRCS